MKIHDFTLYYILFIPVVFFYLLTSILIQWSRRRLNTPLLTFRLLQKYCLLDNKYLTPRYILPHREKWRTDYFRNPQNKSCILSTDEYNILKIKRKYHYRSINHVEKNVFYILIYMKPLCRIILVGSSRSSEVGGGAQAVYPVSIAKRSNLIPTGSRALDVIDTENCIKSINTTTLCSVLAT